MPGNLLKRINKIVVYMGKKNPFKIIKISAKLNNESDIGILSILNTESIFVLEIL